MYRKSRDARARKTGLAMTRAGKESYTGKSRRLPSAMGCPHQGMSLSRRSMDYPDKLLPASFFGSIP
jgi:hypothetical protein